MGFSRQEYWSGLLMACEQIVPGSPALQADSILSESPGKSHSLLDLYNLKDLNNIELQLVSLSYQLI